MISWFEVGSSVARLNNIFDSYSESAVCMLYAVKYHNIAIFSSFCINDAFLKGCTKETVLYIKEGKGKIIISAITQSMKHKH